MGSECDGPGEASSRDRHPVVTLRLAATTGTFLLIQEQSPMSRRGFRFSLAIILSRVLKRLSLFSLEAMWMGLSSTRDQHNVSNHPNRTVAGAPGECEGRRMPRGPRWGICGLWVFPRRSRSQEAGGGAPSSESFILALHFLCQELLTW